MDTVSVADAKARLSELIEKALAGEPVEITRRGRPVARLVPAAAARKPVDPVLLRSLTGTLPSALVDAETLVRDMREGERY